MCPLGGGKAAVDSFACGLESSTMPPAVPEFASIRPLARCGVLALAALGLSAASPAQEEAGIPLAADKARGVEARLVETEDAVRIDVSAPEAVLPSVAIDANRSGDVDRGLDFMVSAAPDGSVCLSRFLAQHQTSPCEPPGETARLTKRQSGTTVTTSFLFPKHAVSADGFGFGFAIDLWNETRHKRVVLASGDYRFGGRLRLLGDARNFQGNGETVPKQVFPAVDRYQSCLDRGIRALGVLEPAKLAALKQVRPGCAAVRAGAVKEAEAALVAAGGNWEQAEIGVRGVFESIDARFAGIVAVLEGGPGGN
jgi:hypothetical protein